jgi:hypothetical protein
MPKELFNDALMKALSPVQKKMKPHAPEQKEDEEPSFSRKYQGPPTVQREGVTNA